MTHFRVGVCASWQARLDEALQTVATVPSAAAPTLVDRSRADVLVQRDRTAEAFAIVDARCAAHPVDEGDGLA